MSATLKVVREIVKVSIIICAYLLILAGVLTVSGKSTNPINMTSYEFGLSFAIAFIILCVVTAVAYTLNLKFKIINKEGNIGIPSVLFDKNLQNIGRYPDSDTNTPISTPYPSPYLGSPFGTNRPPAYAPSAPPNMPAPPAPYTSSYPPAQPPYYPSMPSYPYTQSSMPSTNSYPSYPSVNGDLGDRGLYPSKNNGKADGTFQEEVYFRGYYTPQIPADFDASLFVYAHTAIDLTVVEQDRGNMEPRVSKFFDTQIGSTQIAFNTPMTVAVHCDGLHISPDNQTHIWEGKWCRFDFTYRADESLIGKQLNGHMTVEVYGIEITSIPFSVFVSPSKSDSPSAVNPLAQAKLSSVSGQMYKRIFVSYSRKDSVVIDRYRLAQLALGNDVFVDRYSLKPGESWQAGLARAIDEADIFQLFWSETSSSSPNVKDEWMYALEHKYKETKGDGFIRPIYWTMPMPAPPSELGHLNFRYIPLQDQRSELIAQMSLGTSLTVEEKLELIEIKLNTVLDEIQLLKKQKPEDG